MEMPVRRTAAKTVNATKEPLMQYDLELPRADTTPNTTAKVQELVGRLHQEDACLHSFDWEETVTAPLRVAPHDAR